MKKTILSIFTFSFILSGCGTQPQNNVPAPENQNVSVQNNTNNDYIFREINNRLRTLETRYITKLNSTDRDLAQRELNEVYYLLYQLNNNPNNPYQKPMNPDEFNQFISRVKAQSFDSDKINLIQLVSKTNWFYVNQISETIKTLSFDSKKIDVLSVMYPKSVDRNNGYKLIDLFTFSSDKEKARQIIESYPLVSKTEIVKP